MAEGFVYEGRVHDLGFIFWEVEGGILKNDQESNGDREVPVLLKPGLGLGSVPA